MAAVPKNKITRTERGKRRQGNTPQLVKNTKQHSVPLHKQSFMGKLKKFIGVK